MAPRCSIAALAAFRLNSLPASRNCNVSFTWRAAVAVDAFGRIVSRGVESVRVPAAGASHRNTP
ncbi:MAG: hypothetical protein ABS89_04420 [Thiobacillus sp. SCN 63-1177]|nr:MAG: hypothetical protein ABS89_04420 [Thiobacillus sp. SCN 63-1177]